MAKTEPLTAERFFALTGFGGIRTQEDLDQIATARGWSDTLRTNQEAVFANLAQAGDNSSDHFLDESDFEAVQRDPKLLARLIKQDPEYKADIALDAKLRIRRRESPPDIGFGWDGIPPIAYGRLMTYVDLAYCALGQEVPVDGRFDRSTAGATRTFQEQARLQQGRNGSFIDRSTLGSIVLHLEIPPDDLVSELNGLKTRGAFFLTHDSTPIDFRQIIIRALQLLYPEEVPPWRDPMGQGMGAVASAATSNHYDGATLIGPVTIDRIIDDLRTAP